MNALDLCVLAAFRDIHFDPDFTPPCGSDPAMDVMELTEEYLSPEFQAILDAGPGLAR